MWRVATVVMPPCQGGRGLPGLQFLSVAPISGPFEDLPGDLIYKIIESIDDSDPAIAVAAVDNVLNATIWDSIAKRLKWLPALKWAGLKPRELCMMMAALNAEDRENVRSLWAASEITRELFSGCTSLALKSLPASVTIIRTRAFSGCTNLALTSLPANVTMIATGAFSGCTSLALKSLPDHFNQVRNQIKSETFKNCRSLALTSLPGNVTEIGPSAFSGCTSLALTSLPDSLTYIGEHAFFGCPNLKLTKLPDSVRYIGQNAFDDNLLPAFQQSLKTWWSPRLGAVAD